MKDTPDLLQMQQQNATPVTGEHLEVMGKRAASLWAQGRCGDLSEGVGEVVKQAGLSPEQVRRVTEFANINAFLVEHKKEGSASKYVDFGEGQIADPGKILQDLNDGGSPAPPIEGSGISAYTQPPEGGVKQASLTDEDFEEMFGPTEVAEYPMAEPDAEHYQMCDKLAGAVDHLTSDLSGLEVAYQDAIDVMRGHVKQACLTGVSMGDTVRAWSTVTDEPLFIKCASEAVTATLLKSEVFRSHDAIAESITKTSSARVVNPKHPLVTSFQDYCEVLHKLAKVRGERDELAERLGFIKYQFEKGASGGIVGKAMRGLSSVGKYTGALGEAIGGKTVGKATRYLPHAAAAGGVAAVGAEGSSQIEDSPIANLALSAVPGTKQERNRRQIRRMKKMQGAQGNPLTRAGVQYMGGGY